MYSDEEGLNNKAKLNSVKVGQKKLFLISIIMIVTQIGDPILDKMDFFFIYFLQFFIHWESPSIYLNGYLVILCF
jgi:hypothetical protein